MPANQEPIFVSKWRSQPKTLRPADASACAVSFLAGANGSRVHAMNISSSDTSARDVIQFHGVATTLASACGTVQYATTTTLSRTVGSFVTDGWVVGDRMIPIGSTTRSNDNQRTITAVTATLLTFTETVTTETIPSNAILYKATQITQHNIPVTAGYLNTAKSVDGLLDNNASVDPAPNRYMTLGGLVSGFNVAPDAIIVAMASTITAAKQVDITTYCGDY